MEISSLDNKIKSFVKEMKGKRVMPLAKVKEMYNLYNIKFDKNESNYSCHLCVMRIFNKLKRL